MKFHRDLKFKADPYEALLNLSWQIYSSTQFFLKFNSVLTNLMLTVNHETNQETSYMNEAERCNIQLYFLTGIKNGVVVRALPSHRCHLGLIPGDDAI